jgi:rod shape-determining protein MreC
MLRQKENKIFFILLIISLTILSLGAQGYKNILNLKNVIYFLYTETYNFFEHQTTKIEQFFQSTKIHKKTFVENINFKKEIIKLRDENLYLKNFIINKGLQLPKKKGQNIARIISWDIYAPYETLIINKGYIDEVKRDDTIVDDKGNLIGKIIGPISPHTAKVMLLSSSKFGAGVKIGKEEELGIFFGTGKNEGIVKYIKRTSKIVIGSIVKTSGLDNLFPENIVIGRVRKVSKSYYYLKISVEINFFKNNTRVVGILKR